MYIMLEDRLEALFKDPVEYKILERSDWLNEFVIMLHMLQVQGMFSTKQEI